jgi:hypothetical protein
MSPEDRFERIENAIRDLIVVSRTTLTATENLVNSQKEVTQQIRELREAQATTDEKLNILIDTLERIIRRDKGE